MKKSKLSMLFVVMMTVFILAGSLLAADEGCKVEKMVFAQAVESREPVDEAVTFAASTTKVYCWTKLTCSAVPCTIKHVWYLNNAKVNEVTLSIKYPTTRTWSNKTVSVGEWKAEVTDEAGKVLESKGFSVK